MIPGPVLNDVARIVGKQHVLLDAAALACYGYDAFLETHRPGAVIAPGNAQEVADVVRLLANAGIKHVARGNGTGYAGGALPINGEVVILLTRLQQIRELNCDERYVWVEAGVRTAVLQDAVARHGLRYPPDPSSLAISTIGGNIATNAGGPHCLGYGVTSNYVLELECVTAEGALVRFGARTALTNGLDIRGLIVGSEGTMTIVTAARLRLVPAAQATRTLYAELTTAARASAALCEMFRQGIQPIALDMTCGVVHPRGKTFSFPNHTMLYIEVDGDPHSVEFRVERICDVIREYGGDVSVQSRGDLMQKRFQVTQMRWRGITECTENARYFLFDAVVRRSKLAEMLEHVEQLAREFDFIVANTFHAGDGNIHPTAFFDPREPTVTRRLEGFRDAVLNGVEQLGGALSGEHGIGIEKIHLIPRFFPPVAQHLMRSLIDAFQPGSLLGSGKLIPSSRTESPGPAAASREVLPLIDVENGYAIVGAACPLVELQRLLEPTAYEFPYEPVDCIAGITLGELILRGPPALRERKTGPARDLLLGGTLINRHGVEVPFGSVFAKDVSGLDLRKVVFGSNGRLGELRSVILKLVPKEQTASFGRAPVASPGHGANLIRTVEAMRLPLSALYLARHKGSCHVGILIEGSAAAIAAAQRRLASAHNSVEFMQWRPSAQPELACHPAGPLTWTDAGLSLLLNDSGRQSEAEDFVSFSYPPRTGWHATEKLKRRPEESGSCAFAQAVMEAFDALR